METATAQTRKEHWEKIYKTKQPTEVSWYENEPKVSLGLVQQFNLLKSARIMDSGGGDSHLVDYLLKLGYQNITVLDISEAALERAKKRLGPEQAMKIEWVVADEAECNPDKQYDLWHDRAAFHFLTDEKEINNYVNTIKKCIKPGGYLILATFSEQGPKKCSGLQIKQYSESSITELLKHSFEKIKCFTVDHHTPFNTVQNFLYCSFKRKTNTAMEKNTYTNEEIAKLDPYQLMAALGKKVIHPGGKQSTEELYAMANLKPHHSVLEIGCGVGTTAIDLVKRFGCSITITDIDQRMVEKAERMVQAAGMGNKIKVQKADIQQLPYAHNSFDIIIIEAVTMFVNRKAAISEVNRVCKQGGKVIEHEFIWRKKPTPEARRIFEGEVCPGIKFDTTEDWVSIYESHGFRKADLVSGPFRMMSPQGFLKDEGIVNTFSIMIKALSRAAYMKKMFWLMPRIMKVKDSLGYIVLAGEKV